jgi:ABC-type multidrug transport system fused ATPase/permease subunit
MTKMDAFTDRLPEKSLTTVGELGGRISGGQKQRLCLSRAMIRKAPILVFDEATSALDNKTERQILASIRSEYPESTLMMVAHRMNAVTFADKIFVLEDGEILEEGTHLTLMQKNGRYAALMRMQTEEEPQ